MANNSRRKRHRILALAAAGAMAVVVALIVAVVVVVVRRPEAPPPLAVPPTSEPPAAVPPGKKPRPEFQDASCPDVSMIAIPGTWESSVHQDPFNPVDSIAVAARAINNIIGGATLTGSNGRPVVQPGLESSPANCVRYTGSAALRSRAGYPSLCARPMTQAGQALLVADVYQKWIVGATPTAAQNAAVLFQNSTNPGDPRVQAILKGLPTATH